MYYVGKLFQGLGLGLILVDYLRHFPDLMSRQVFWVGTGIFAFGWVLNRYLLKK